MLQINKNSKKTETKFVNKSKMRNQCGIEVTRVVRVFLKNWQNDSKIPVKRFNF